MNSIYMVRRLLRRPDVFVATDDTAAIAWCKLLGPVHLFCLGNTDLPVGHLFTSDGVCMGHLVKSWTREERQATG